MKDRRRDLRSYRKKVAVERRRAERFGATCHLCGQAIDMTLHPSDKFAFTLDHLTALKDGGHIMGDTLTAHRSCNSSRNKLYEDPLAGGDRKW